MNQPEIYRKRLIPDEIIHLKDDVIVECNRDRIITRWKTLKPRKDIDRGISCYCLKEGYKISKLYDSSNRLVMWYCDIMEYQYDEEKNALITLDLLADVLIYPDGTVRVVDLDELSGICESKVLSLSQISDCLKKLDSLLKIIYSGDFMKYQRYIEQYETFLS